MNEPPTYTTLPRNATAHTVELKPGVVEDRADTAAAAGVAVAIAPTVPEASAQVIAMKAGNLRMP
ncbi:hypothetical protein GCM10012284_37500 [Mangrovihabitans endophyticus]|uniref:Uncharacterized protein n=1 Tax=Mangrovihabitans endophyticus TaxID=1751298 RepID=A0A8J3C2P1_9ACTN|nr:hypothetical protein GCM10012284_37500 [Mangrovihabitans endophyticus]